MVHGYRFGLPVIATDVGSLREDVVERKTGYVCGVDNPDELVTATDKYFASDRFRNLETTRQMIRSHAVEKYSWTKIAEMTWKVYENVLQGRCS